ncbi:MAG: DUF4446 family protein [Peptococcia bacterium]|jgi:hypothetical protein
MADVFAWIAANSAVIILSLTALVFILLLIFLFTLRRLNKTAKKYQTLVEGAEQKNLEQIILDNTKALRQVMFELNIFRERLEVVEEISEKSIQKVGLQRFDAFDDIGGEMSYAVAFLNKNNDGVIISSIFARDDARTYCKPVQAGKSQHALSPDEQKAIRRALGFTE